VPRPPLPAPLPPETRTVGQLVAEAVKLYGARFWPSLALGIGPALFGVADTQLEGAARAVFPRDPWSVAAFHVVTTLTGSALLALALAHGFRDEDQVWAAAHVDEDWNSEKWGVDEEVAARRAARLVDFKAAAGILKALRPAVG